MSETCFSVFLYFFHTFSFRGNEEHKSFSILLLYIVILIIDTAMVAC